jgi:hypothetical protein
LVARHHGALDVSTAVAILRDRKGPGDADRALGHRGTINPMIATHSVVADVTSGVIWVSRGPHQLGAFDAYTIAAFGEPVAAAIPDDPALADGTYARLVEARERLAHAETEADLRAVLALTPGDPSVLLRLAVSLEGLGREAEALAVYRAARAAEPAFREERDAADAAIARLEQAPNPR